MGPRRKHVAQIQIALDENGVMRFERSSGIIENGGRHRIRLERAELLHVAVGQEHSSVVSVDQPEQLEVLLLDVGILSKDERLSASGQSVFNGEVDENFVREGASALRCDEGVLSCPDSSAIRPPCDYPHCGLDHGHAPGETRDAGPRALLAEAPTERHSSQTPAPRASPGFGSGHSPMPGWPSLMAIATG